MVIRALGRVQAQPRIASPVEHPDHIHARTVRQGDRSQSALVHSAE
jgi:hypothetical protein